MTFSTMLLTMTSGMLRTILLFILTLLGAIPLGMLVVACKKSKFKPLAWLTEIYIAIMRGTPLMLQLLVWYFGPAYLFGWKIGKFSIFAQFFRNIDSLLLIRTFKKLPFMLLSYTESISIIKTGEKIETYFRCR